MISQKSLKLPNSVMPSEAGIQFFQVLINPWIRTASNASGITGETIFY